MTRQELKVGDILVADYSNIPSGVMGVTRGNVCYVVLQMDNGDKIAASFSGDANCGPRPAGWYELSAKGNIPYDVVAVYRPKSYYSIFNGDFENEDIYERIY